MSRNFKKIKIDSYKSLPIKSMLIFHVIILIKLTINKSENKYYYNIFFGKGLYKDK